MIQNSKSYGLVKFGVKKGVNPGWHDSKPYSHMERKKKEKILN